MGQILDIFGASKARKAQEKAADKSIAASTAATDKSLALQKQMFDQIWQGTQVQRDAGNAASSMMARLMGLSLPAEQPSNNAIAQSYPTGQAGAAASYGGQAPQSDIQRQVAAFGDTGMIYGDAPANALAGEPMAGATQYGRSDLIGEGPVPQAAVSGPAAAPANALDPTAWLRSTPGYDFNLKEGMRALNTGLAGQGRLQSGEAAREAIRYGQNYGDRIYGDQWNRLAGIAGAGQTATSQGAQSGQNYANNGQNALQWNANNLSSSYQNKADATSGFWGDMSGMFGSNAIARYAGQAMKGGF